MLFPPKHRRLSAACPASCSAKADLDELLEGWTYGCPPTYAYSTNTVAGIADAAPARPPLVTRPGTLPGSALEHVVQPGDFCFQAEWAAASARTSRGS